MQETPTYPVVQAKEQKQLHPAILADLKDIITQAAKYRDLVATAKTQTKRVFYTRKLKKLSEKALASTMLSDYLNDQDKKMAEASEK